MVKDNTFCMSYSKGVNLPHKLEVMYINLSRILRGQDKYHWEHGQVSIPIIRQCQPIYSRGAERYLSLNRCESVVVVIIRVGESYLKRMTTLDNIVQPED